MDSTRARLARLAAACDRVPGLLALLEKTAQQAEERRQEYKDTHWGDIGETRSGARGLTVPDLSEGVTVMGRLCEIAYVARKGVRRPYEEFVHRFDDPYPVLGFAWEGSRKGLVIVRDRSRYTVNYRGIVG